MKTGTVAARAALAIGAGLTPHAAHAATITVNTLIDHPAPVTDSNCSLREAIGNANANSAVFPDCTAGTGADTIDFSVTGSILLAGAALLISDALIVDGPGQASLTIDANNLSRIFTVIDASSGTTTDVTIQDVTLTNGNSGPESIPGGGAIYSEENLTLASVTIANSDTPGNAGGGVLVQGTGFTNPDLTIRSSMITGNSAGNGGGIAVRHARSVSIQETEISGNAADGLGGGLYLYGVTGGVTIAESVISGNGAGAAGGGLVLDESPGPNEIRDTTISGNTARYPCGGVCVDDSESTTFIRDRIVGNVASAGGGLDFRRSTTLIADSEISGNEVTYGGGGVFMYISEVEIINSTIAHNSAPRSTGGGINVFNSVLSVSLTTISGNSSGVGGGNIYLQNSDLDLENSIVANGTAPGEPDIRHAGSGGITANWSLLEVGPSGPVNGANNIVGTDPQLGSLQNNGGPTLTMKPAGTSPVVNAGDPAFDPPPAFDQRGAPFVREIVRVDMGAVEVEQNADLSVTKIVTTAAPFTVGENATFLITVSNAGPDPAANTIVTDVLQSGMVFVSATPSSGSCAGTTTVTCEVGTLANGATATVTLTVQLATIGTLTNTATSSTDSLDASPATGSATITVGAASAIPALSGWVLIALAGIIASAAALRVK